MLYKHEKKDYPSPNNGSKALGTKINYPLVCTLSLLSSYGIKTQYF